MKYVSYTAFFDRGERITAENPREVYKQAMSKLRWDIHMRKHRNRIMHVNIPKLNFTAAGIQTKYSRTIVLDRID